LCRVRLDAHRLVREKVRAEGAIRPVILASVTDVVLDGGGGGGPQSWSGQDGRVLIVRATKKLLRLAGPATVSDDDRGTTLLGPWYATVLFWRPRVVLLVNEVTLLPVRCRWRLRRP
jgi:hypothetical protein